MLNGHVLVLNKSWVALNVTPMKRALTLLVQDHARVIHPYNYAIYNFADWCELSQMAGAFEGGRFIHTPSQAIRLPEVIILHAYNGFYKQEVRLSRRNIFERDKHRCQYCNAKLPKQELTIDHVLPRSRGGRDTWDNLVLACMPCNVHKGNRTPDEARMPLLRRPKTPKWLPRFGTQLPKEDLMNWQRFVDLAYWNTELGEE